MSTLPIAQIVPATAQPRTYFAGLEELAASIRAYGLLEPIMVRPISTGDANQYQIVHGERRYRAALLAGLTEIPATIRALTDDEAFTLAIVENTQRSNLTPLEEAAAFAALQARGKTQAEIGALIGKGQSYVAHKLRLLRLPAPLTYFLATDTLGENHVRQVMRLRDIYPPGLRATDGPDATWQSLLTGLTGAARHNIAREMIIAMRPEEMPFAFNTKPPEVVCEGCTILAEYVAKHTEGIPQWVLAAFWWLSLATRYQMSVALLAARIDSWSERYESALCWWYVVRETPEPEDARGWAVYADLKHSASLALDDAADTHTHAFLVRLWEKWRAIGYTVSPSEMQGRGAVA